MIYIRLKTKKYCSDPKDFGETFWHSKDNVEIVVSSTLNDNLPEFLLTVLHELLHVWFSIIQYNGIKIDDDESFIVKVEKYIVKLLYKMYGVRNEKKNKSKKANNY